MTTIDYANVVSIFVSINHLISSSLGTNQVFVTPYRVIFFYVYHLHRATNYPTHDVICMLNVYLNVMFVKIPE